MSKNCKNISNKGKQGNNPKDKIMMSKNYGNPN